MVINNCTSTLSSDHSITYFDIAAAYSFKKTTRYVLDFSKCDFDSLNSYLWILTLHLALFVTTSTALGNYSRLSFLKLL